MWPVELSSRLNESKELCLKCCTSFLSRSNFNSPFPVVLTHKYPSLSSKKVVARLTVGILGIDLKKGSTRYNFLSSVVIHTSPSLDVNAFQPELSGNPLLLLK